MVRPRSGESILNAVEREGTRRDLGLLGAVPAVLVVVFALPAELRRSLALEYGDPTLLTAYTSHFVHLSASHLLMNVVGYVLIVPFTYLVATAGRRRRQFWVVFTVFLVALPFALSGFNLIFLQGTTVTGVGFSGVVMAFLGYLPVTLTNLLGREFEVSVTGLQSSWLFFAGVGVIAYVATPGSYGVALAAAALLSGLLFLLPVVERVRAEGVTRRFTFGRVGTAEFLAAGLVVYFTYPLVAFPQDVTAHGGRINTYSHALGFCLGYLTTYATLLVGGVSGRGGGSRHADSGPR